MEVGGKDLLESGESLAGEEGEAPSESEGEAPSESEGKTSSKSEGEAPSGRLVEVAKGDKGDTPSLADVAAALAAWCKAARARPLALAAGPRWQGWRRLAPGR